MSELSFKNEDGSARNTPRALPPTPDVNADEAAFDARVAASLARLNATPPAPSTATPPAESTLQKVEDAVAGLIHKESDNA